MREIMNDLPELSDRAAITIAEAMREMAQSDGAHPQEVRDVERNAKHGLTRCNAAHPPMKNISIFLPSLPSPARNSL